MESLRNESSPRALVSRPGKPTVRSRPLTAYGLRRLSRERLMPAEPHGGRPGRGLQALAIVELELECGLALTCGQGDAS